MERSRRWYANFRQPLNLGARPPWPDVRDCLTDPGLRPRRERSRIYTSPEIKHLLAALLLRPRLPGHAAHWLNWRRRHQARARWHHQRTRIARDAQFALVN